VLRPTTDQGTTVARHRSRTARLAALLLAVVLALSASACADESTDVEQDPEGALREAVEAVGDWSGIRIVATLDADETARRSLAADGETTEADLDLLLGASLTATVAASDDPERGGLELVLTFDGMDVAEVRVTEDERYFARIDLDALEAAADDSELAPTDLRELVAAAQFLGLGEVAQAAVEGRWVELIGLDAFADLAGQPQEPEADEAEAEAAAERVAERTSTFIERDVEVTSVGSDDVGERVRATTSGAALRTYLDGVRAELDQAGLVDEVGGGDLDATLEDLPDDAEVTLDAWIRDGQLQQVAVDLAGLDEEDDLEGELWLLLRFEEYTGTVAPPEDATPIDLFELFGAFLGSGMGGGLDLGDGVDDDAFEDDGADDGALEDDGADDGALEDDGSDGDDLAGAECITDEELEEVASFLGEEGLAELEALIDAGILERC
jgi:hypothetical protein